MILLDTHIWRWWAGGDPRFRPWHRAVIESEVGQERGVSVISCWEMAKAIVTGNLILSMPVDDWIDLALRLPGITLIDLTPRIAVESTRLPAPFHRDPGDQIIVATARILDCPLLTADEEILAYPNVKLAWKP
jgi:PIN domain nuclease of toxin-antitoxin system